MAFVLDCSIPAVWALGDEESDLANLAAERLKQEIAIVPSVWWYEMRNLLVVSERRNRLTEADSTLFLGFLSACPIRVEPIEDEDSIFRFSRRFGLSFYDAAYLETAHRHSIGIATLDRALEAAAQAAGVPLLS